ncbi:alpha-tocopherol transfer protein-like isoform X1 [Diorhabda carinulata]|uniref:alpha-tocopherol transfer protein-like isoform X1 n=2 Tax=Diorhabda carinulata TaxID=1163345 RepID=UPI0025A1F080|nr:alpha-tocopherol transfer protein-like isoform X1 [Diorhabda carinulata]
MVSNASHFQLLLIMSTIPKHGFKAEDILKENRTTKSNIEDIKNWLSFKRNIPRMSDEQIVIFLLACKNNLDETKITIENFFKYKSTSPEIFMNRDIDMKENKFTCTVTNIAVFPNRTEENYAIALGSLKDTSYYNFCIEPQIKRAFAIIDAYLYSNPPDGLIFIIDIKGVGIMHLTRIKLNALKVFFAYIQEALPIQLRQVHILNANYIFEKFLMISKPFMKKELYEMIITHSPGANMQEFFEKYIPASSMPSDYGGDLPSIEKLSEDTRKYLQSMKTFLEAEEKQIQLYKKD